MAALDSSPAKNRMIASQLVDLRRQREVAAANHLSAVTGAGRSQRQGHGQGHASVGEATAGSMNYYLTGRLFDRNVTPEMRAAAAAATDPPAPEDWQGPALRLLEDALDWIQAKRTGPTVTARLLYIWAFTAAAAWQSLTGTTDAKLLVGLERSSTRSAQLGSKLLTGTHDGWDWDWRTAGGAAAQAGAASWLGATLAQAMAVFLPGYTPASNQIAASWFARWQTWWTARAADGSVTAVTRQPTAVDASNVALQINVTGGGLPIGIRMDQWTPLNVQGTKQSYLTFFWGGVTSTCLTGAQEAGLYATGAANLPTEAARAAEVAEVAAITGDLTDREKATAELWAGGPGTVTPPGTLFWIWAEYCRQRRPADRVFFLSGLDLAVHLFEGSRITWGLKARHIQARPIQEIRARLAGTQIKTWDGTTINASNWIPYQEANFVTPPFGDYPSGHSNYSASFAHTMNTWFGRATGGIVPSRRLDFFAPVIGGSKDSTLIVTSSTIQPGVVPAAPITFSWQTWADMAEDAGISRLYGGIHCRSAHVGSKAVAAVLDPLIEAAWGFKV